MCVCCSAPLCSAGRVVNSPSISLGCVLSFFSLLSLATRLVKSFKIVLDICVVPIDSYLSIIDLDLRLVQIHTLNAETDSQLIYDYKNTTNEHKTSTPKFPFNAMKTSHRCVWCFCRFFSLLFLLLFLCLFVIEQLLYRTRLCTACSTYNPFFSFVSPSSLSLIKIPIISQIHAIICCVFFVRLHVIVSLIL